MGFSLQSVHCLSPKVNPKTHNLTIIVPFILKMREIRIFAGYCPAKKECPAKSGTFRKYAWIYKVHTYIHTNTSFHTVDNTVIYVYWYNVKGLSENKLN
jgi:hypothetical protein